MWRQYRIWKGLDEESDKLARQPYHEDSEGKNPRYYQRVAIQRAVEAIAQGQRRVLLVMATGTGKTFTVFQIIWRLWKAEKVKRVLFLVDRNILADQAVTNDFKPFGPVMTKVGNRNMDPSYEVYVALYQAVSGSEEEKNVYRQFSRGFLILWSLMSVTVAVLEKTARGGKSSITLSLLSNSVYGNTKGDHKGQHTYLLWGPHLHLQPQASIEDGFLAPFKVMRIDLDRTCWAAGHQRA